MMGFIQGTAVVMEDGTPRPVENVALGERVMLGGQVQGVCARASRDICLYKSTAMDASTPIFAEAQDGFKWVRVKDLKDHKSIDVGTGTVVYGLITQGNVVIAGELICSDMAEHPKRHLFDAAQAIEAMNADKSRQGQLREIIGEFQTQRLRNKMKSGE